MKNYIRMTERRGEPFTMGYLIGKIISVEPFKGGSVVSFIWADGVAKRLAVREKPEAIWAQYDEAHAAKWERQRKNPAA
jgi:hypothetical protein